MKKNRPYFSIFIILVPFCILAQTKKEKLRVCSISEFADVYVIKGIDTVSRDTISIISIKETPKNTKVLERIVIGKYYNFDLEDLTKGIAAVPPNDLTLRVKRTVVWHRKDGLKKIPFLSKNTRGIWITKFHLPR